MDKASITQFSPYVFYTLTWPFEAVTYYYTTYEIPETND